jgi:hypothetical protein
MNLTLTGQSIMLPVRAVIVVAVFITNRVTGIEPIML